MASQPSSATQASPPSSRSAVTPTTPSSPTRPGPPFRSPTGPPTRPLPQVPSDNDVSLPDHASVGSGPVQGMGGCNPFQVDLVIPFDISAKGDRAAAQQDALQGYQRLVSALENEGGLRIASRPGRGGKGCEDVWVFVGASDAKVAELVERERIVDLAHGLHSTVEPMTSPATRLRLLYQLLTAPTIQHGLGITPAEGQWKRVKSIVALHDDARDNAWVERWTVGGDWKIGLLRGLSQDDEDMLGRDQPPALRLYFNFLTTYTMSLIPMSIIGLAVWIYLPVDSYPPAFALLLSLYACSFIATWRIRERKLAVDWGTRGTESMAIDTLRPQYVQGHNMSRVGAESHRTGLIREVKVVGSIPLIIGCGVILGCILMGIFMLEAFVGHLWHGPGKSFVPYVPTALFSIVVPQVVALFNGFSRRFVTWEDHATTQSQRKSLTAKTFAMNSIVAYLGLFLSAYVYLPFGPYVMHRIQDLLSGFQGADHSAAGHAAAAAASSSSAAASASAVAAAAASAPPQLSALRSRINVGRLKNQVFAYTVTNQVVNTFLEVGLPYILRFVNDWRAGKTTIKGAFKQDDEKPATTEGDAEKRFLDKVGRELELPAYNIFVDYAEMVTQFGYVVVWGLVWPLAPVFALINNYFELRSDALKICKHVQRPVGERVETIGTWLDTMGIIAWVGAWTSATLIQLFRPRHDIADNYIGTLAGYLATSFDAPPTFKQVLPLIAPVAFAALVASHGYFVLNYVVTAVAERVLWMGSPEQIAVDSSNYPGGDRTAADVERSLAQVHNAELVGDKEKKSYPDALAGIGFWNGPAEGAAEITRAAKTE